MAAAGMLMPTGYVMMVSEGEESHLWRRWGVAQWLLLLISITSNAQSQSRASAW